MKFKVKSGYLSKLAMILFGIIFIIASMTACAEEPDPPPTVDTAPTILRPEHEARLGSSEDIVFEWTAVENANAYSVIIAGNEINCGASTSYVLETADFPTYGAEIGQTIIWNVVAYGVVNKQATTERTFELIDDVPPEITEVLITTESLENPPGETKVFTAGTNIEFSATITDNVDVVATVVDVLEPNNTTDILPSPITLVNNSGDTYTGSFEVDDTIFTNKDAIYTIKITATDAEGNESDPGTATFRLDGTPPEITNFAAVSKTSSSDVIDPDGDTAIIVTDGTLDFSADITDNVTTATNMTYEFGIYEGTTQLMTQGTDFTVTNPSGNTYQSSLTDLNSFTTGTTYTIRCTATDENSNTTTQQIVFKVDPVPPEVTDLTIDFADMGVDPPTEFDGVPIFNASQDVTYDAVFSENIPNTYVVPASVTAVVLNADGTDTGVAVTANQLSDTDYSGTFNTGTLTDSKTYTLKISGEDGQGNVGSGSLQFKIDSSLPLTGADVFYAESYEKDGNVYVRPDYFETKFISDQFIINGKAKDGVKIGAVYVVMESDDDQTAESPDAFFNDIPNYQHTATWHNDVSIGTDTYMAYEAAGAEDWSAIVDISGKPGGADGNYYVWLVAVDVVGNYTTTGPVDFNTTGNPAPANPNMVVVDTNAPTFDIYMGDGTYHKYEDYEDMASGSAWTLSDILLPTTSYDNYTGDITADKEYDPTQELIDYVDYNYEGTDTLKRGTISMVDLDIFEEGGENKKLTVEVTIDGTSEAPMVIYTGADTVIGTETYNADFGYKNDDSLGMGTTLGVTRISKYKDGASYVTMNGEQKGIYQINLLDFPKGTGNIVPDGIHNMVIEVADEAGNSTQEVVTFHSRLLNRPILDDPYNNETINNGAVFQWYHPRTDADTDENADRIAHAGFVSKYYIDFSSNPPLVDGEPSEFESSMVTKEFPTTAFTIREGGYYDVALNDALDIENDEDLGSGEWYWRVRAVMENTNGDVLYEIGSDNLPFALNDAYSTYNYHSVGQGDLHQLNVGRIYAPNITSTDYAEYFGTSEQITISWDPPTGGLVPASEIDGYRMQMRALSPQGEDGGWVDILGSYNGTTHTAVNVLEHQVDVNAAPINGNFGMYQFRLRSVDNDQPAEFSPVSGWTYSIFVYTPDSVDYSESLAEQVAGMPYKVKDMAVTDSDRLVIITEEDNRIWVYDEFGNIETSVTMGANYIPEMIIPATEKIEVAIPNTSPQEFEFVQVESLYVYVNESGNMKIKKINHEYEITDFEISDFSNINLPYYIDPGEVIGIDFYDDDYTDDVNGTLYAYYKSSSTTDEVIVRINPAIQDYTMYADLEGLTDFDSNPAISDNPKFFKINSIGEFLIVDDQNIVTKLQSDGAYYDTFDLNTTFTESLGGEDPIAATLNNVIDFEVYERQMNVLVSYDEIDDSDTTPPILDDTVPPEIIDDVLVITYNESLNPSSTPAVADFIVNVAGVDVTITEVLVFDAVVQLTLESAVLPDDEVKVSYTPGDNPVQDMFQNNANGFTGVVVTNSTARGGSQYKRTRDRAGETQVRTFILSPSGLINEPLTGYDGSMPEYDLVKIAVGSSYIISASINTTTEEENIYKLGKTTELIDMSWASGGSIQAGNEWSSDVIATPGRMAARDNISSSSPDGYAMVASDDAHIYVTDRATQQVININGPFKRSDQFKKISGIAVSPNVGSSGGIYVTDAIDNALYQLSYSSGSGFAPVTTGSFDDDGKLNSEIFYNYDYVDDDGDPATPDVPVPDEITLNQPMGIHLEPRPYNGSLREYLFIADYGNGRVACLMLTNGGQNATKVYEDVRIPNDESKPIDVAVFDRNNVMYVLAENGNVYMYRREGNRYRYRYSWNVDAEPLSIDADQFGCVYVTCSHAIYKYGFEYWPYWSNQDDIKPIPTTTSGLLFGSSMQGTDPSSFNIPMGISVGLTSWIQDYNETSQTGKNFGGILIYVADSMNRRIQVISEGTTP